MKKIVKIFSLFCCLFVATSDLWSAAGGGRREPHSGMSGTSRMAALQIAMLFVGFSSLLISVPMCGVLANRKLKKREQRQHYNDYLLPEGHEAGLIVKPPKRSRLSRRLLSLGAGLLGGLVVSAVMTVVTGTLIVGLC